MPGSPTSRSPRGVHDAPGACPVGDRPRPPWARLRHQGCAAARALAAARTARPRGEASHRRRPHRQPVALAAGFTPAGTVRSRVLATGESLYRPALRLAPRLSRRRCRSSQGMWTAAGSPGLGGGPGGGQTGLRGDNLAQPPARRAGPGEAQDMGLRLAGLCHQRQPFAVPVGVRGPGPPERMLPVAQR